MSDNYKTVLWRYMEALKASDYVTIKSLFAEDGTVTSPFLGLMPVRRLDDTLPLPLTWCKKCITTA